MTAFQGFARVGRSPGTRNLVPIVSGDLCCNPWSQAIAGALGPPCFALAHKHGVSNFGPDRELFRRIMSGITTHPNVAGLLFVSSGNEDHAPETILADAWRIGVPADVVTIRDCADGSELIRKGTRLARKLAADAQTAKRSGLGIEELTIGLNCAGTDAASARSSNLVCGIAVDILVAAGATVLLTETPDLIGIEDELESRCVRDLDRVRLRGIFEAQRVRLAATGERADDLEMVSFNVAGGLKTLREKAKVSILKAGTAPIQEVVAYGERPTRAGLIFMDGPAFTDFALTGLMSAGAHLTVSTCGEGPANAMPFVVGSDEPPPMMPVLKVTASTEHFRRRANRIDFDTGALLAGTEAPSHAAARLVRRVLAAASGAPTRTEDVQDYLMPMPMSHSQA
jgi:altronate dehydratase large subunit